jgi:predicted peptidase
VDDVVDVNYSAIYKKLKPCNSARTDHFDDAGHDSWTRVYDNREIYDWMFEQIKKI